MKNYAKELIDAAELIKLKDQEIERQIARRKLAEQTRNWIIILVVIIHLIIWIL
ncbi:MAG: hypothetical protein ACM3KI_11140 [Bacillota bacterium]